MSKESILAEIVRQQQIMAELRESMCDIERRVPALLMEEEQEKAQELYAQYFRRGCEYFKAYQIVCNLKLL